MKNGLTSHDVWVLFNWQAKAIFFVLGKNKLVCILACLFMDKTFFLDGEPYPVVNITIKQLIIPILSELLTWNIVSDF